MISKKLEKGATDSSSIFREAKATKKKKMTVKIPEATVISIIRSMSLVTKNFIKDVFFAID